MEEIFDISFELNMANIVFITNVNECPFEIIEFVILFTKYYIHCCRWSNNLPTIEVLNISDFQLEMPLLNQLLNFPVG
jgi:hypothetical protein